MDLHLNGKSVVIVGGSTGIGLAAALEFAHEGAKVLIAARSEKHLSEAKEQFASLSLGVETRVVDATRQAELTALGDYAISLFGKVDVWVNNAGGGLNCFLSDISSEQLDAQIDINFKSVFWGSQTAAALMKAHGGVILNTSSFAIKMPLTGVGMYAAMKSAVHSLTKSLSAELAPYGIRVVSIVPGFVETPMTADAVARYRKELTMSVGAGRLGKPEDLAKPIVFLASDAADYISGVPIEISGAKYAVQDPWSSWQILGHKGE